MVLLQPLALSPSVTLVHPVAGFQDTGAFSALAESGGPWHSLLWVLLGLFSFPACGNGGREGAAGTLTKGSGCADGELISAGSSRTAGEGWAGGRIPPQEAAGLRAAMGLPSHPPAAQASCWPSTRWASPLHHHMGTSMSWCMNIAVQLQRETHSSWTNKFLSSLKRRSVDVMVCSTMTASECSAPQSCLSFLHSQGSRVRRRHVKGIPRYRDGSCPLDPLAPALQLMAGVLQGDGICGGLGGQKLPLLGGR